jgi:hypothetical protein
VVSRSPVYAAIWFAMALAGVSGVLLVLGGQFLGVATIVVYAGAILVMFLFVLMLAQPAGLAPYDRVSSEPLLAAVAGAVLLGILSLSIGRLTTEPPACCHEGRAAGGQRGRQGHERPGTRRPPRREPRGAARRGTLRSAPARRRGGGRASARGARRLDRHRGPWR